VRSGPRIDRDVVIVTGAAGRIGSAIVRRLDSAGATVVAQVRSVSTGSADVDGAASSVEADLRTAGAPTRIVERARHEFGHIDALVNVAAIQSVVDFMAMTDEDWAEMIDTNLTAAHRLTAAVARSMVDSGRGGSVVHIASIEGSHPAFGHSHYATAKAGLIMHARAAALELGRHGIRVNSVSPGLVDRPGLDRQWPDGVSRWIANAPLSRLGTGREIADACLFLISDMSSWVTGTDLVVDGGMSACPPW